MVKLLVFEHERPKQPKCHYHTLMQAKCAKRRNVESLTQVVASGFDPTIKEDNTGTRK